MRNKYGIGYWRAAAMRKGKHLSKALDRAFKAEQSNIRLREELAQLTLYVQGEKQRTHNEQNRRVALFKRMDW